MISCSKREEDEPTVLFEVFEYKTTTPVEAVQVSLLKCSDYDIQFGCQSTTIFASRMTDNTGRCSFTEKVLHGANKGIKLSNPKYWDTEGYPGTNYIAPEGWIMVQLTRQNVYSVPRLFYQYDIDGESGHARINPFTVPLDTIVKIRAFGNEVNRLNWRLGSGSMSVFGGGFGFNTYEVTPVLASGILTQSPGRFGTTSITLSY
jgi:hypothetical protein